MAEFGAHVAECRSGDVSTEIQIWILFYCESESALFENVDEGLRTNVQNYDVELEN
jgi:hypothetical protein